MERKNASKCFKDLTISEQIKIPATLMPAQLRMLPHGLMKLYRDN
jgi:hypothetical protein